MRYRLRTLLILLAILPPLLAGWWWAGVEWSKYPAGLVSFAIISFGILISIWSAIREPDGYP